MVTLQQQVGNIEYGEMPFRDLYKLHDWDGLILKGLTFRLEQIPDLVDYIKNLTVSSSDLKQGMSQHMIPVDDRENSEIRFMPEEKNILGIYFLNDNVNGSDGLSCYFLKCDRPDLQFHPLIRLAYHRKFSWIEDFKSNCHDWYLSGIHGPSTSKEEVLHGKVKLLKSGDKKYVMK